MSATCGFGTRSGSLRSRSVPTRTSYGSATLTGTRRTAVLSGTRLTPLVQALHDLLDHIAAFTSISGHGHGSYIAVGVHALCQQRTDPLLRVTHLEDRAFVPAGTAVDGLRTCLQHHHRAAAHEHATVLGPQHRSATGAHHHVVNAMCTPLHFGLVITELLLPDRFEYSGDPQVADAFDHPVGVDEREAEAPGELPADPALACAHEPRQCHPGHRPVLFQEQPGPAFIKVAGSHTEA